VIYRVLFDSNRKGANMKKVWLGMVTLSLGMLSSTLLAAPGEWWEITAKMEMPGMPFAMPGQTNKLCLPKGGEKDPRQTQGKDSNCKMTDVQHSGNTVKYKGTCVTDGETMNMVGETTHDGKSFKSKMRMTGKSHGEPVDMTMTSSGKYIGGACDTEEMGRKAKAQLDEGMARACDTSKYTASNWIYSANMFLGPKPTCPGKKEQLCKVVRNDVPRDLEAFQVLEQQEKNKDVPSIANACNANVETMRKSLCKTKARSGPLHFLEANCPAEAKAFRELQRKREECEGRGFTSGAKMKKCMGGDMIEEESASPSKSGKKSKADDESGDSSTTDTVLDGAKKLKGLFGF
jgi:Protein of unknown function (DUF3617)